MKAKEYFLCAGAGACAGAVTGLFGAGGGMVLVPLLSLLTDMDDDEKDLKHELYSGQYKSISAPHKDDAE